MTNDVPQIDLSGLKGLHEGIKPDFWPLAAGWYILGLGLILCVFLGLYLYKKYQMRPLPYALKELKQIEKKHPEWVKDNSPTKTVGYDV